MELWGAESSNPSALSQQLVGKNMRNPRLIEGCVGATLKRLAEAGFEVEISSIASPNRRRDFLRPRR